MRRLRRLKEQVSATHRNTKKTAETSNKAQLTTHHHNNETLATTKATTNAGDANNEHAIIRPSALVFKRRMNQMRPTEKTLRPTQRSCTFKNSFLASTHTEMSPWSKSEESVMSLDSRASCVCDSGVVTGRARSAEARRNTRCGHLVERVKARSQQGPNALSCGLEEDEINVV